MAFLSEGKSLCVYTRYKKLYSMWVSIFKGLYSVGWTWHLFLESLLALVCMRRKVRKGGPRASGQKMRDCGPVGQRGEGNGSAMPPSHVSTWATQAKVWTTWSSMNRKGFKGRQDLEMHFKAISLSPLVLPERLSWDSFSSPPKFWLGGGFLSHPPQNLPII